MTRSYSDTYPTAASIQGENARWLDTCPICGGDHDRVSRRDWDGCGDNCGPCPRERKARDERRAF